MNILYNIVSLRDKYIKNRQAKKTYMNHVLLIMPMLSIVIAVIIFQMIQQGKTRTIDIDDGAYVQQLFRQAIPESMTIVDPVWGAIAIDQPEKVFEYYQVLSRLPYADSDNPPQEITKRELSGTIKFRERPSIEFVISKGVLLDGLLYSGYQTETKLAHTVREMRAEFFTPENLARLVNANMHVVIRHENERKNLTVTIKKQLKEAIGQSRLITDNNELSTALRTKGQPVCQIELYPGTDQTPSIYLVIFENDLAVVYDVEASIGSDMHLIGDWKPVIEMLNPTNP